MTAADLVESLPACAVAPRRHGPGAGRRLQGPALAWVALIGLIATITVVVICGAHTPVLAPASTDPEPSWLAGPIGMLGPNLGLAGVIVTFGAIGLCYATLVMAGGRLRFRVVLAAIVLVHLLIAIGPPLMSTDVFSYGIYGRMGAIYKLNPYLMQPRAVALDPWFRLVDSRWSRTPTVYGPAFTALSYVLAGLSVRAGLVAYRWIAVLASLSMVAATYCTARRLDRDVTRAVTIVGLNPVLLIYGIGGDHNDLIMVALLVGSIMLLTAKRAMSGTWLAITAVAVKVTGAVLLPFALVGKGQSQRARILCGVAAASLIGLVLTVWLFGIAPLRLLSTLQQVQGGDDRQSIPGAIATGLGIGSLGKTAVTALQGALVAVGAGLLLAVRAERMDWLVATGWAVAALLVCCTFLQPWYVIWLLPFAALAPSRALRASCLALTAVGLTSL